MEYNPNPACNPNPALTPDEQLHKKDAVTAMVCGIIGLVLSWYGIFSIAGLVLSIIGFVRAKKNREFARARGIRENGMNNAGYICGLIGIIISSIAIVVSILAIVAVCALGFTLISEVLPTILHEVPAIIDSIPAAGSISGLLLF